MPYHTSHMFNFSRHLKQHPGELDKFLKTSFNYVQSNSINNHEYTKDTSQTNKEIIINENFFNNILNKKYEENNFNSWKIILRNIFN